MKRILVCGDIFATKKNYELFIRNDIDNLVDKSIQRIMTSVESVICNLEAPITQGNNRIIKEGPNLKLPLETCGILKRLNVKAVTLANNHILDYSKDGLTDTMNVLSQNNIGYFGAGRNLKEADSYVAQEINGAKICFYGCTEHEFTIATDSEAGANPFDPLNTLDRIRNISQKVDRLIVLYHGGKEFYRYPSPYLKKVCRKIIDCGASMVLCQHTHCIGTYEEYNDGMILYGQGNFLVNRDNKMYSEYENDGLIVEIDVEDDKRISYKFLPITKSAYGVRLCNEIESKKVVESLEKRSVEIKDDKLLEEKFEKVSLVQESRYLLRLSKIGALLVAIDNRIFSGKLFEKYTMVFNQRQQLTLLNMLQCEVHNELVRCFLEKSMAGKK